MGKPVLASYRTIRVSGYEVKGSLGDIQMIGGNFPKSVVPGSILGYFFSVMKTHQEISLEEIKKLSAALRGNQVTHSQMDATADYLKITADLLILIQNKKVSLKKLKKMIFGATGQKVEQILGDKPAPTLKK